MRPRARDCVSDAGGMIAYAQRPTGRLHPTMALAMAIGSLGEAVGATPDICPPPEMDGIRRAKLRAVAAMRAMVHGGDGGEDLRAARAECEALVPGLATRLGIKDRMPLARSGRRVGAGKVRR